MRLPVAALVLLLLSFPGAWGTARAAGPTPAATPGVPHARLPEPIPLVDGVDVVFYWLGPAPHFRDELAVYGELRNTTGRDLDASYVLATEVRADGTVRAVNIAVPLVSVLPAGRDVPFFSEGLDVDPAEVASVRFALCPDPIGPPALARGDGFAGIEVRNVTEVERTAESVTVEGDVVNTSPTDAPRVVVTLAYYDAQGRFEGAQPGALIGGDNPSQAIPAGARRRFRATGFVGNPLTGADDSFEVWAERTQAEPGTRGCAV